MTSQHLTAAAALLDSSPALEARGLRLETTNGVPIVEEASIDLRAGEICGLVGESGSGKTTFALALLGYTEPGVYLTSGEVLIAGKRVADGSDRRRSNGDSHQITYIPQNPGTALNPSLRLGPQIRDVALAQGAAGFDDDDVLRALAAVRLPADRAFARRYPHQLSGGQQQRVSTAAAIGCEPRVVVLDEPTTGLDVITQARVLGELRRLCKDRGVAMLYVTHDLAVVAQIADKIAVMYAGRIVEAGPAHDVLRRPRHPYTQGLLRAVPDHASSNALEAMIGVTVGIDDRPPGCPFSPRCPLSEHRCEEARPALVSVAPFQDVRCVRSDDTRSMPPLLELQGAPASTSGSCVLAVRGLSASYGAHRARSVVAEDINFELNAGQCVALVGESGSGKSTIARTVAGLHPLDAGSITLNGVALGARRSREQRRQVQIVFQNPMDALNPRRTVGATLVRVIQFYRQCSRAEARAEVNELLGLVRLPAGLARRYPAELSGGEAQRVGLARALAAKPDLIVCDEITSALDVSSQAAVLGLLKQLQTDLGMALLFITHDIGVVAAIGDEVLVLSSGLIVESGPTAAILENPAAGYTRKLLDAAPSVSRVLSGAETG